MLTFNVVHHDFVRLLKLLICHSVKMTGLQNFFMAGVVPSNISDKSIYKQEAMSHTCCDHQNAIE